MHSIAFIIVAKQLSKRIRTISGNLVELLVNKMDAKIYLDRRYSNWKDKWQLELSAFRDNSIVSGG